MNLKSFQHRHIGPRDKEIKDMVSYLGYNSLEELVDETVPKNIRTHKPLELPEPLSEFEYSIHIQSLAKKNKIFKTYIGLGYHPTILPPVIQRNILENPGWYTAYTPYQAEISQGRLEALLNFQTVISDLTQMEIANASLLDEGTAAAEAMSMFYSLRNREQKSNRTNIFYVDNNVFPQTIAILQNRCESLGVRLKIGDIHKLKKLEGVFGVLLQYPNKYGEILDETNVISMAKLAGAKVCVAADIMSLVVLEAPGTWGADAVIGTSQRFGIPMGYGGPHAAYFATKGEYKRYVPGRIIGITKDKSGKRAYRMALQTREQHIKREKATSNICTSQVLLAVMAGMYAIYHGREGLLQIANEIHKNTVKLYLALVKNGFYILNSTFFDTITLKCDTTMIELIREEMKKEKINLCYSNANTISISLNETTTSLDINKLISVLLKFKSFSKEEPPTIVDNFLLNKRNTDFLKDEIFNSFHSETEMMRYIKSLEKKDLTLNHSMISLGSCTMKLNAAVQLFPLSDARWANIHPFAPKYQAKGYHKVFESLENYLSEITGFAATSLQPNSGAQGEYAGLMIIRKYHQSKGETHRNIAIIPASAHGTNPASAHMAGMEVVVVKTDKNGNVDFEDLQEKVGIYKDHLAALMITYPSTYGVFEEDIVKITEMIHKNGGLVYMDGANMNAQIGLTQPFKIGADVCHLNLHKTFAIPHGGGGPGVGPICVADSLKEFLPTHPLFEGVGGKKGVLPISAAPYGSALILLISYGYIKMLGNEGLTSASKIAILNANYIKKKLSKNFTILYQGKNGGVAHELILDCRGFKDRGIEVSDMAKRLMDYGYHAPTVSFPVPGTLMIEPTESEGKKELDRFVEAMNEIFKEINSIEDKENNILRNSPHTKEMLVEKWNYPYTREQAIFPLPYIRENKYWPAIRRADDAFGDRNFICTCSSNLAFENTTKPERN